MGSVIAVAVLAVLALLLLAEAVRDLGEIRESLISIHVRLACLKEQMDQEEKQRWHLHNRLDTCRWMLRDIRAGVQTLTGPEEPEEPEGGEAP